MDTNCSDLLLAGALCSRFNHVPNIFENIPSPATTSGSLPSSSSVRVWSWLEGFNLGQGTSSRLKPFFRLYRPTALGVLCPSPSSSEKEPSPLSSSSSFSSSSSADIPQPASSSPPSSWWVAERSSTPRPISCASARPSGLHEESPRVIPGWLLGEAFPACAFCWLLLRAIRTTATTTSPAAAPTTPYKAVPPKPLCGVAVALQFLIP
mmetsp:Transcript_13797/g.47734  ORF Transcript_13797/g.47734 Transcript_13797/m.47734 type:complete len:208 (-) Transcript_13797:339-962(-)